MARELLGSIVINTLNRAMHLQKCLRALSRQTISTFEVIVVNGPSSDETNTVLDAFADHIKIRRINQANISKSRNCGIAAASGDIVVFLDDDAYAEPGWLANILAGYNSPQVGGVGTRVWDHTGFKEQLNPRLIDETYTARYEIERPLWAFEDCDSKLVPHILGASSSFRIDALRQIGGFDEEIEYFLDESEVCRRIAEAGYLIRFIETGPGVHHKYAAGVVRDASRILKYPYPVVKNKFYVTLSDCRRHNQQQAAALSACSAFAENLLRDAGAALERGDMSRVVFDAYAADVTRARKDGIARAAVGVRQSSSLSQTPDPFKLFTLFNAVSEARRFIFITKFLPATAPGGVAQFLYDLAVGFARRGHHVHIITQTPRERVIDFEDDVWIHRLPLADIDKNTHITGSALSSNAGRRNFAWSKMAHTEIRRIHDYQDVDLVICPIWDTEGLHCIYDPALKTVLTLQTTFKTYSEIEAEKLDAITVTELRCLEAAAAEKALFVHAISTAIREDVERCYGRAKGARWETAWLGIPDVASRPRTASAEKHPVNLLYASRLERRKGVDIFLEAIPTLLACHPNLNVTVIGHEPTTHGGSGGLGKAFLRDNPGFADRVSFLGEVDNTTLEQAYTQTDLFCVPTRFESFGLVFVEAMRAGKAVVATNVGGVPEVVVDQTTGLLVPPDDCPALVSALDRLIADAALREAMGKAGRLRYDTHFSVGSMIERVLGMYLDFIGH